MQVPRQLRDHEFVVTVHEHGGAWWVRVVGSRERRHGPWPDPDAAARASERLFGLWNRRARSLGGWAWKRTASRWIVTLPVACATEGRPLRERPCSWHRPCGGLTDPSG